MSELWAKWEGQVVDGRLPLRRLIGVSDHSGVFLTEAPDHGLSNAALKLVPAIPTLAESQLAHWNAAANLSHTRLLRLYATGRCQLPGGPMGPGNQHFLYVLMEYADQNLAQLLESRALTEVEARETLPSTLEALAFLHSRNLVQGQLKPSNILVVGEQLKLASDTIRPAGESATSISMVSVYDPPEGRDGSFSTAGDIWALGVTLYEALTRTTPSHPAERSHGVVLPPDFPAASADVIRECLSRRPTDRPSVAALQAWLSGKVRYPGVTASGAVAADANYARFGATEADRGVLATADAVEADSSAHARTGTDRGGALRGSTVRGGGAQGVSRAELAGAGLPRADGRAVTGEAATAGVNSGGGLAGTGTIGTTNRASTGSGNRAATGNAGANVAEHSTPTRPGPVSGSSPAAMAGVGSVGRVASGAPGRLTIRVEREPIHEEPPPERRSYLPLAAAAAAVLIIGWGAVRLLGHHSSTTPSSSRTASSANTAQPTPQSSDSPAQVSPGSQGAPPVASAPKPPASTPSASERRSQGHSASGSNSTSRGTAGAGTGASAVVLHEEIPNVPNSALATIHGHVKVAVRVTVDSSGNVVDDSLDHAGPSHYFARIASQAARKWKFAPTDQKSDRQWVVHFDFSRAGPTAHATSSYHGAGL